MSALKWRFAQEGDAPLLAKWAAENRLIDPKDIEAANKEKNPTSTFFVVERDGVPVLALPGYLVLRIGYLIFNPEADKQTREDAMELMLTVLQAFAAEHAITTIDVLTRSGLPVAEWAREHGFTPDPRELFIW